MARLMAMLNHLWHQIELRWLTCDQHVLGKALEGWQHSEYRSLPQNDLLLFPGKGSDMVDDVKSDKSDSGAVWITFFRYPDGQL